MNRDQFISFVRTPEALDSGSSAMLERLVKEYPYCQTAEILYALNLNKENNFRFTSQLKTAAAYASDRRILKQLLSQNKFTVQEEVQIDDKSQEKAESKSPDPVTKSNNRKQELAQLIERLNNEVEAILTEEEPEDDPTIVALASRLKGVIDEHQQPEGPIRPDIKDYNFSHLNEPGEKTDSLPSNEDLIDKFIKDKPKIAAPQKAEFFDPIDYARHGLEDKQEIVSETLAKVYITQGNTEKAIKIYEQLCLVYPEKSSFFAAQIEKIKKDQHTDH